jgi:hypothetical protein
MKKSWVPWGITNHMICVWLKNGASMDPQKASTNCILPVKWVYHGLPGFGRLTWVTFLPNMRKTN